jgi:hypothetical protein
MGLHPQSAIVPALAFPMAALGVFKRMKPRHNGLTLQ